MGKTWLDLLKIFILFFFRKIKLLFFLGSCHYKTPTDYYTTIERLYSALNIPDIRSIKNPSISSIKNAFLAKNSKLFASAIYVSMNSDNLLKEIKFCYNLNHQFTNCNS